MKYTEFLKSKSFVVASTGKDVVDLHPKLFEFQKDIVRFAVKKGRSAIFADCGLGKTFMQRESAREEDDEKHICPLQLEVIRRCLVLWSKPGDLILDPFAGIGSTGYVAIQNHRRFVGCELKKSYWQQAKNNLINARQQQTMIAV